MNIRVILIGFVILLLLLSSVVGGYSYYVSLKASINQDILDKTSTVAKGLRNNINDYVNSKLKPVSALAALPAITHAVARPDSKTLAAANTMLDHFCQVFVMSDCYLMNRNGLTIASSNPNKPKSFLSQNFALRPYFKLAMQGNPTSSAALDIVSKKRGIYFSTPVYVPGQIRPSGVVVTKYLVDTLEKTFRPTRGIFALTDHNGMVVVTNRNEWLFRTIQAIEVDQHTRLIHRRRFSEISPDTIALKLKPNQRATILETNEYLLRKLEIDSLPGWHLLYLRDTDEINDVLLGRFSGWVIYSVLGLFALIVLSATILYRIGSLDIRRRRLAERSLHDSEERLRHWNNDLTELVKSKILSQGELKTVVRKITEVTSNNIDVERVSVWLFTTDRSLIRCIDLYTKQNGKHAENMEISASKYPRYFKALEDKRVIAADDAPTDPDTSEFADNYLRPLGITAMLDATIRVEGEVLGVLCCEHVHSPHHWGADEQNVAGAMADLVAMALQADSRRQAEEALRNSEASLAAAQRIAQLGNWDWDIINNELQCSEQARKIFYLSASETNLTPDSFFAVVHPDDKEFVRTAFRDSLNSKRLYDLEHRIVLPHGEVRTVHEYGEATYDAAGNAIRMIGTVQDITERRRTEHDMTKLSRALEQTADAIMITDRSGKIEYVNSAFEQITGFQKNEILGKQPNILNSGKRNSKYFKHLWDTILSDKVFRDILINRKKDGTLYHEEKTINSVKNPQGEITHFVAAGKDISERMQIQQRLAYLAHHDVITDLPNRALFMERLEQALARARRSNTQPAVLFVDLDRFKNINDTLGHGVGDQLLQAVARRIPHCLREEDTAARLGGDEFTILLEDASKIDTEVVSSRIMEAMSFPFQIDNHELFISASIGICQYPYDGHDAEALIKNADTAMYRAKESGRNGVQFYTTEMGEQISNRLNLETSLRYALARNQLFLEYQPLVELSNGRIYGVEALVRWQHPEQGLIPPLEFIPILEEAGLIDSVGEWVLRTACSQAVAWRQQGLGSLRMSVNISGRQFKDPDLAQRITVILEGTGLDASALQLEITESVIMENASVITNILEDLTQKGISMAIDDFGTGYSSLSYLKRLPVSTVKIDRSFVSDISNESEDAPIVKSIIAMAHNLKLEVVAEGVETSTQQDFLRAHSCDAIQGLLFSAPLSPKQLEKLLQTSTRKKKQA